MIAMNWHEGATDLAAAGSGLNGYSGLLALTAGVLAYLAGWLQAQATRKAADRQLEAAAKKDRVQSHCIVVGVYPELLMIKVAHERALAIMNDTWRGLPGDRSPSMIAGMIRDVRLPIPPLLNRNIDQLYLLGDAAPSLLQLVSTVLRYNAFVDVLAEGVAQQVEDVANKQRELIAEPLADLLHHPAGLGHAQLLGQLQGRLSP